MGGQSSSLEGLDLLPKAHIHKISKILMNKGEEDQGEEDHGATIVPPLVTPRARVGGYTKTQLIGNCQN